MKEACEFLKECATILKIPTTSIIITPGNHDIIRTVEKDKQWDLFEKYTKEFCTPLNKNSFYMMLENKLIIFPLNSMRLSRKKTEGERGILSRMCRFFMNRKENNIEETPIIDNEELDKLDNTISNNLKIPIRIAALHHHVIPVYGLDPRYFDTIMNAGILLNILQKKDFSLILHGHKHAQSVKFIQDKDLTTIGMYVIGVKSFNEEPNYWFNEIDIIFDKDNLNLPTIRYNSYFFQGATCKQAGATIDCSSREIKVEKQPIGPVKYKIVDEQENI